MAKTTKIVLASIAALLLLLVAFYGNFLPLRKSQVLIRTLRTLNDSKSLEEFKGNLSVPLNFPSPIGQEEAVRNIANIILGVVQQTDNPEAISDIINFIESYYKPIISRGTGMSFEQNVYILGAINELAFVKTKEIKYLTTAHNYFEQGLRLGPNRPQFLYGMFDIYRIEGSVEGAKEIAGRLLAAWPDDQKVKDGLEEFLKKVSENAAEKK